MYTKALYIAVDPVGSKFAKGLQQQLRSITNNKIFRVSQQRADRKAALRRAVFRVTPRTLNKIEQFQAFSRSGVSCPGYSLTVEGIEQLESKTIFARKLINSTNGRGIIEFEKSQQAPRAPLYTAYIPKKAEYRVHVFGDKVIDIQQKKKKRGFEEDRNTRVRNMANGYVYCRDGITPPTGISDLAIAAVRAVGYQYGAVDIIYNEKQDKCFVLEVNSRPGLLGTTLENYANALANLYDLRRK